MEEINNELTENVTPEISEVKLSEINEEKFSIDLDEQPEMKKLIDAILNLSPKSAEIAIKFLDNELAKLNKNK